MTPTKQRLARKAKGSRWLEGAGRAGLVARATVYIVLGVLAVQVAFGDHERTDTQGALQAVARQPLGKALVLLVAVGMAAMVVWRLVLAALDPTDEGPLQRATDLGRAALYGGGFATALQLVLGGDGDNNRKEQDWTARAFELPPGRWLVAAVGLGIVAAGLWSAWRAFTGAWEEDLDAADAQKKRWARPLAIAGLTGRMLVFGLVGGFLVRAAVRHQPREGVGLDAALEEVGEKVYGPWALAIFAGALIAYGLYSLLQAGWREVAD